MKKRIIFFIAGLAGIVHFSVFLFAGFEMKIDDEVNAKFGFKVQNWLQAAENASPDNKSSGLDFSIRTLRFYISGQVNAITKFNANVDWQRGVWDGGTTVNNTAVLRDAGILLDYKTGAKLMLGLFRTGFSRLALQDSFGYLLPHSPDIASAGYLGDTADFRNFGLTFLGELPELKIKYSAGIFDGDLNPAGLTSDDDSPFYSARFSFSPFYFEKGYANQGSYLGKDNILSIGTGFMSAKYRTGALSPQYTAWTIDVFSEWQTGPGTITTEAAYFIYNRDISNGVTSGWYGVIGYLLSGVKIQPVIRYEKSDREGTVTGGEDFRKLSAGLNWYLKGQDSKIQLEYSFKDFDTEGTLPRTDRDYADVTLTFQLQF